jgi:tetratricopeptide (TPR) repeat protein
MSACHWSIGDYATALTSAQRGIAVGKELGDDSLRLYAGVALTWIHHSLGDYGAGVRAGREAVDFLKGDRLMMRLAIPSLPAVLARTWLVSCLVELGQFGEAAALADEALRLAEDVGEPWSLADAALGLGVFRLRQGEAEEAVRVLERGAENCRRFNIDVWMPPLTSALGYALALTGRVSEALDLLGAAIGQATATGHRFYHTLAELWIAEALYLDGRSIEATSRTAAALQLAERYGEMGNKAYALRLMGEASASGGGVEEAERHLREAIALAVAHGMRPLEARCRLSLAGVVARSGNAAEAQNLLRVALDTFHELGLVREASRTEQTARDLYSRSALEKAG